MQKRAEGSQQLARVLGDDARACSRALSILELCVGEYSDSGSEHPPTPQKRWLTARPCMGSPPGGVKMTVLHHPRIGARRSLTKVGLGAQSMRPLALLDGAGEGWPGFKVPVLGNGGGLQRVAVLRPGLRTFSPRASQGAIATGWRAGRLSYLC
jgi:hypothetical protein